MWPEGFYQWKIPLTLSGIEPVTFRSQTIHWQMHPGARILQDRLWSTALISISRNSGTDPLWIKTNSRCLYAIENPTTEFQKDRHLTKHIYICVTGGTRWRSWLRHCATSWKVVGSIRDGVTGIFHWHNPSGHTMALGVDSASNRNEHQEYFLGSKGGRCVGLTTLSPSCDDCHEMWEPQPPGTLRTCPGL
jgi:hypothetical protein